MADIELKLKTTRVRLIYEKRGGACFVPHVSLGTLFARSARRAGMEPVRTEGFSPRARMSFGPELPAGVVALNEPVDLWLKAREGMTEEERRDFPGSVAEGFNAQLPEGFRVMKCVLLTEGAPALGKDCKAAHYLVWTRNALASADLLSHMENHYEKAVLNGLVEQAIYPKVSAVLANPAQNGIGGWVKALIVDGLVAGWRDMCIVRLGLGCWNGERMEELGR